MKMSKKYLVLGTFTLLTIVSVGLVGCSNKEDVDVSNVEQIEENSSKINLEDYEIISIVNDENIDKGNLILVNNSILYNKDTYNKNINTLKSMDKLKNDSYGVYYKGLTLNEDAIIALNEMSQAAKEDGIDNYIISSAFRTAATQQQFLDREIKEVGEELGRKYVAQPYGSEHQTGLAIDYRLLDSNGDMIRLRENHSEFEWLRDNCYKYGYILRYLEEKKDITNIEYEPWHYRYVGVPHAQIMTECNLALEEYIDFLKDYKFGVNHIDKTVGDKTYEIYFIGKEEGETTNIYVPKDKEYTISGNNLDGYIITIEK